MSERNQKGIIGESKYIYGEIEFQAIAECFYFIKNRYEGQNQNPTKLFIDLGHGTGKGVLAACLLLPFEKCMGIEFIETLHTTSELVKIKYEEAMEGILQ